MVSKATGDRQEQRFDQWFVFHNCLLPFQYISTLFLRMVTSFAFTGGVEKKMALSFRLCFLLVTLVSGVAGGPLVPRGVTLNSCSVPRANERQVFVIGSTIQLATQTADGFTLCVTAANGSPGILTALPCNMSTSGQGFSFAAGIITSTIVGNPIVAAPAPQGGPYYVGQPFSVLPSSAANGTEQFVLNTTGYPAGSGVFVHTASGMCLDAGPLPNAHACLDPAIRYTQSFCDPSLPIPDRVGALISRLTLAEKISLTGSCFLSSYVKMFASFDAHDSLQYLITIESGPCSFDGPIDVTRWRVQEPSPFAHNCLVN